jgi:hypothetical protein
MKSLLIFSLITNVLLIYFLLTKETEKEVVERIIVETHSRPVKTEVPRLVEKPQEGEMDSSSQKKFFSVDAQEGQERVETERERFMVEELGIAEDKIQEHNRLREEYYQKTNRIWGSDPTKEPSFAERRLLIDLEEKLHRDLEKLHGKQNWKKYQEFRERYNSRGASMHPDDMTPLFYMGL